jgi:hypothetical protein
MAHAAPSPKRGVVTVRISIKDGRAIARPGRVHLGFPPKVEQIRWENHTGKPILLWFPTATDVFSTLKSSPEKIDRELTRAVKRAVEKGHHKYVVFCEATKSFAQANSEPQVDVP